MSSAAPPEPEIYCPADIVTLCDPRNCVDEIFQHGFVVLNTFGQQ